jgi:cell wall assembly regulator SMI1
MSIGGSFTMEWEYKKPIDEKRIREVEMELGVHFPKSFFDCVLKNNAGRPKTKLLFDLGNEKEKVFGNLFNFNEDEDHFSILEAHEVLIGEHEAPIELVPFADDPAGNFICFDYRTLVAGEPIVVFFYHERDEDNIKKIADSFSQFLEMLYEPRD